MAKNKTVIKKPSGNGNISITIENNLKNTNTSPAPKKRRRRQKAKNDESVENSQPGPSVIEGGGGGPDVSYIKPPTTGNYSVWRDTFDSYNTTIPSGQAQSLGLTRPTISDNNSEISSNIESMKKQLDELTQKSITPTFQKYGFDDYDDEVLSRADSTMFDDFLQEAVAASGVPVEQQKTITDNIKTSVAKKAGTTQGERGVINPFGPYVNYPEFKEAYKIGLNTRKNTPIDNRKEYTDRSKEKKNLQIIAEEEDLESEEEVIVKKKVKPKKKIKKVVYESESESDSEVVVRKKKPLENLVYQNTKDQLYNRMIEERVRNSILGYANALGV